MEENLLEQPDSSDDKEIKGDAHEVGLGESTTEDGSNLGKFKDAKSLLTAYRELEAEFTRKCQKLAEFEQKQRENAVFEKYHSLDELISNEPNSDKYKKEITEILSKNSFTNLPNKFETAFEIAKLVEEKTANLTSDPDFLNQKIYSNEDIKEKIISNYLNKLNGVSTAPNVMTGSSQSIFFAPDTSKPKTIREAGEIFSKMLK